MRHSVNLVAAVIVMLIINPAVSTQTIEEASYRPYRFHTPDGKGIYFQLLASVMAYRDEYLIVLDAQPPFEVWILSHRTGIGRMIGAKGGGCLRVVMKRYL